MKCTRYIHKVTLKDENEIEERNQGEIVHEKELYNTIEQPDRIPRDRNGVINVALEDMLDIPTEEISYALTQMKNIKTQGENGLLIVMIKEVKKSW